MKKHIIFLLNLALIFSLVACSNNKQNINEQNDNKHETTTFTHTSDIEDDRIESSIHVDKIEGLSDDFMLGVDISSILSLEASGRKFYDFNGKEQDIFKTLSEFGVNYIRVRVWNNPFDENGNGYGGGNCTVDTAIEIGKRAKEYGMGLFVDFHYSDFWADPGKQQVPKAWENMSVEEKEKNMYSYTMDSLETIKENGVKVGMVQIGNETTGGICGEFEKGNIYRLMKSAAKAVRDHDSNIKIAVHYTNPEKQAYSYYAEDLKNYGMEYDIFASSYYPEYHGTIDNLKNELTKVHNITGKNVIIAETSWSYSTNQNNSYASSVQGQADEIYACINAMNELGDYAVGVFYWEPAWIDVPGTNENEKFEKREKYGAGWASSYAGAYDPEDAGKYYGASSCINTSLFDTEGHPLESLKTFLFVKYGTK